MKERKNGEEGIRIKVLMVVSDHIQKCEKDVKCVKNVESDQEKIETNLVLESRHLSCVLVVMQTFRRRTNIERMLPMTPSPPMMNINTPDIQICMYIKLLS